jgi:hypothetical protein
VEGFSAIATYSAKDSDFGTGKLSLYQFLYMHFDRFINIFSTSSRVEPVATQPGRSGE